MTRSEDKEAAETLAALPTSPCPKQGGKYIIQPSPFGSYLSSLSPLISGGGAQLDQSPAILYDVAMRSPDLFNAVPLPSPAQNTDSSVPSPLVGFDLTSNEIIKKGAFVQKLFAEDGENRNDGNDEKSPSMTTTSSSSSSSSSTYLPLNGGRRMVTIHQNKLRKPSSAYTATDAAATLASAKIDPEQERQVVEALANGWKVTREESRNSSGLGGNSKNQRKVTSVKKKRKGSLAAAAAAGAAGVHQLPKSNNYSNTPNQKAKSSSIFNNNNNNNSSSSHNNPHSNNNSSNRTNHKIESSTKPKFSTPSSTTTARQIQQNSAKLNSSSSLSAIKQSALLRGTTASSIQSPGGLNGDKKVCNCRRSKCLKLYCDCFSEQRYCNGCNCIDCNNTKACEAIRSAAIKSTLERNPNAFKPKLGASPAQTAEGQHAKGCHCKKSGCLKKYCECFGLNIYCGKLCKCVTCHNFKGSEELKKKRKQTIADATKSSPSSTVSTPLISSSASPSIKYSSQIKRTAVNNNNSPLLANNSSKRFKTGHHVRAPSPPTSNKLIKSVDALKKESSIRNAFLANK